MQLNWSNRHNGYQILAVLSSKYLIDVDKHLNAKYLVPKLQFEKNILDSQKLENLWQAEDNDFFSLIYLQILSHGVSKLNFKVNWNTKKFVYRVAWQPTNMNWRSIFKVIFESGHIYRNCVNIVHYRKMVIIQAKDNQLLIKLLRFSDLWYSVPVDALQIVFDVQPKFIEKVECISAIESSLRFNGFSVRLF